MFMSCYIYNIDVCSIVVCIPNTNESVFQNLLQK